MQVIHQLGKNEVKKTVKEDVSFMLTNKIGGYFMPIKSRYGGIFFYLDNMFKVIDSLKIKNDVNRITNRFYEVEQTGEVTEKFFMPYNYNSFVYELDKKKLIEVILDIRQSYDLAEFGRRYKIIEENGKIIVKYIKENSYTVYLAIASDSLDYKKTQHWFKRNYSFDKKRNSPPYEWYVFSAVKIKSKKLVFSFSKDKEQAIKENDFVLANLEKMKNTQKRLLLRYDNKKIKDKKLRMAYAAASIALDNLAMRVNDKTGIFAGLPWFFQFWTRDELISIKALISLNKIDYAEKILIRHLKNILPDGNLANRFPETNLGSADSIGWLFKRIGDMIDGEYKELRIKLEQTISALLKEHTKNSFALNKENETWMDTAGRSGIRIEIQALRLNMYALMYKLTKDERYLILKNKLKKSVKEHLWNGRILADGLGDWTTRLNTFISYYIYPKLLTESEWVNCFENSLSSLWLNWGGLTSIDKNNKSFKDKHTGENNISYHNGDSWFWINNLAALVLHKLNKNKFKKHINKILKASTKEILFNGAIGCHAELSSAYLLKSEGCLNQAWSNAMYIELIDEIF